MKKIYTYILLMACAMMFASCQKEFDGIFEAVIENYSGNNGKVHLNGENYACWDNRDKIQGFVTYENPTTHKDTTTTVWSHVIISENQPNKATLKFEYGDNVNIEGKKFTATYPGANGTPADKVRFDADVITINKPNNIQTLKAPMVATTTIANGCKLRFYNLAALIKMHITNNSGETISLSKIEITSLTDSVFLEGFQSFTQVDEQAPKLGTFTPYENPSTTPSTLTSSCIEMNPYKKFIEIPNNDSRDFYIYVPANQTCQYQVDVYNTNNEVLFSNKTASKVKIERNHIATMPITLGETPSTPQGTPDDPYQITTADQLVSLMNAEGGLSKCYKLMDNIDLTTMTDWDNFKGFGTASSGFKGTFDGNGYTIINGKSDNNINKKSNYGVFACIENATIKNVRVKVDMQTTEPANNGHRGGFIDEVRGFLNTEYAAYIENCIVEGTVIDNTGANGVGGFIGYCTGILNLNKCINKANVKGEACIGGMIGFNEGSITLTDCVSKGDIEATSKTPSGSLVGSVGSFIGFHNGAQKQNGITIQNSYTFGELIGGKIGGIIGESSSYYSLIVFNVYSDFTTSDALSSYAYEILGYNNYDNPDPNDYQVIVTCLNVFTPTGNNKSKLYGGHTVYGGNKYNVEAIPDNLLTRMTNGRTDNNWSAWVSPVTGNGANQPGLDFEGTVGQP